MKHNKEIETLDKEIEIPKSVAVDFDGVLTFEDTYPFVSDNQIDVNFVKCLKDWQKSGGVVILNTARRRSNGTVQPALEALKRVCDFVPDYVNQNIKEGIKVYGDCRKIMADYYIDDRNISKDDFQHLVMGKELFSDLINSYGCSSLDLVDALNFEDNKFKKYTDDLANVLQQKNRAYGNSFDKEIDEWGLSSLCIRISDKYSRLKNLVKNPNIDMGDESLYDTIKDLAGYAILGLNYLDSKKEDSNE